MTLLCCFLFSILVTVLFMFFFFTDTATTEIYTLSLHDALPIFEDGSFDVVLCAQVLEHCDDPARAVTERSEERRVGKECRSRWSPYDQKKKRKIAKSWSTRYKRSSDAKRATTRDAENRKTMAVI